MDWMIPSVLGKERKRVIFSCALSMCSFWCGIFIPLCKPKFIGYLGNFGRTVSKYSTKNINLYGVFRQSFDTF